MELPTLRDISGWKAAKIPLSTPSDEAARMFDALIFQSYSFAPATELGGTKGIAERLKAADPDFPFLDMMAAMGTEEVKYKHPTEPSSSSSPVIQRLRKCLEGDRLSAWEKDHVRAVLHHVDGRRNDAVKIWEDILSEYPQDLYAYQQCTGYGMLSGECNRLRDLSLRILPHIPKHDPYYGYILGRTGFWIEQSGDVDKAEVMVREALQINRLDAGSTHSMSHVLECTGRTLEGSKFLEATEADWTQSEAYCCHLYWHNCLFLLDQGRMEDTLTLWESQVFDRARKGQNSFMMTDAVSLLLRLELETKHTNRDFSSQWKDVIDHCLPSLDQMGHAFFDIHTALALASGHRSELLSPFKEGVAEIVENWTQFRPNDISSYQYPRVMHGFGSKVISAMTPLAEERWEDVADILYPIRNEIWQMGGSLSQQDVLNHLLIGSLANSGRQIDSDRLKDILSSRQLMRRRCGMSERYQKQLSLDH